MRGGGQALRLVNRSALSTAPPCQPLRLVNGQAVTSVLVKRAQAIEQKITT
jgi:hypothetical protein